MKNPEVKAWLARFLLAGTTRYWQAWVYLGVGAASSVPLTLHIAGFDHRFGWSSVPPCLSIAGDLPTLLSVWMVYRVFKENSFGSATVEIGDYVRSHLRRDVLDAAEARRQSSDLTPRVLPDGSPGRRLVNTRRATSQDQIWNAFCNSRQGGRQGGPLPRPVSIFQ